MTETVQQLIEKFKAKQVVIMEKNQELENMKHEYRAEMKAAFGLADGEPANVLELIEAFERIKKLA